MYYEKFKALCEARGVSPSAVSRATGIATSTLTEWKKGNYTPKTEKLQKIADFFEVSIDYLTGGDKPEYYINPETAAVAQQIFENKELRLLFDAAADATPEDLQLVHQMLLALKAKERPD